MPDLDPNLEGSSPSDPGVVDLPRRKPVPVESLAPDVPPDWTMVHHRPADSSNEETFHPSTAPQPIPRAGANPPDQAKKAVFAPGMEGYVEDYWKTVGIPRFAAEAGKVDDSAMPSPSSLPAPAGSIPGPMKTASPGVAPPARDVFRGGVGARILSGLKGLGEGLATGNLMAGAIRGARSGIDPQWRLDTNYYHRDLPRYEHQVEFEGKQQKQAADIEEQQQRGEYYGSLARSTEEYRKGTVEARQAGVAERQTESQRRATEDREKDAYRSVEVARQLQTPVDAKAVKGTSLEPYGGKVPPPMKTPSMSSQGHYDAKRGVWVSVGPDGKPVYQQIERSGGGSPLQPAPAGGNQTRQLWNSAKSDAEKFENLKREYTDALSAANEHQQMLDSLDKLKNVAPENEDYKRLMAEFSFKYPGGADPTAKAEQVRARIQTEQVRARIQTQIKMAKDKANALKSQIGGHVNLMKKSPYGRIPGFMILNEKGDFPSVDFNPRALPQGDGDYTNDPEFQTGLLEDQ